MESYIFAVIAVLVLVVVRVTSEITVVTVPCPVVGVVGRPVPSVGVPVVVAWPVVAAVVSISFSLWLGISITLVHAVPGPVAVVSRVGPRAVGVSVVVAWPVSVSLWLGIPM